MNKKFLIFVIGIALGVLMAFIPGCATNRIDLVDKGLVSVETVPSKRVNILWTDVYQDGNDMVVYGVVQRRSYTSYPLKTHVDIAVLSPEGTVLQETRTQDIYVPRRIPGKGINWKRFEVRFPSIPAEGSKVSIVTHSDSHNNTENNSNS